MIDTKLVLIEGPPGSGKSTSGQKLADEISHSGKACQFFFEWDPAHPIPIGDDLQLGQVISSALARETGMLQLWAQFAQARQSQELITVLESRFWQTSLMLMYIAGSPVEAVLASNRRVIAALQELKPVLIYFAIEDQRAFAERTIALKNAEWQRAGMQDRWDQHLFDAFDHQKWFKERGLSGLSGWLALLDDWALVAKELFDQTPFPKIKIHNPHQDWPLAMRQMRAFLALD